MAVVFSTNGALARVGVGTSLTVVAPTILDNDVMICQLLSQTSLANTISPPDGTWTTIKQGTLDPAGSGNDTVYAVFRKLGAASDSGQNFVFTRTSTDSSFMGVISAWTGSPSPSSPIDATAPGASLNTIASDNVTFPAFDPSGLAHIVYMAFYTASSGSHSFDAEMSADLNPNCTKRYDLSPVSPTPVGVACTSGDSDGSAILLRTWNANATADGFSIGLAFGLVNDVAPAPPFAPSQEIGRTRQRNRIRR